MKGKIIGLIVIILIVVGLIIFGVTRNSGNNSSNNQSVIGKELEVKDLSIDDLNWETKPGVYNGKECYEFTLTNNSQYDVIGVEIDYKTKGSSSETDLKLFDDFMKEHDGYIKETDSAKDVTLIGSLNKLIKKGEKADGVRPTIGFKTWSWYSYPTKEQFELMEPSQLQIGIVGNNKKLYIAYYDFTNKSWSLDDSVVDLNTWPENELSKKLKQPDCEYFVLRSGKADTSINLVVYGVDAEFFKEYVKSVQDNGFTVNAPEKFETYYTAKDEDGNNISVEYLKAEDRIIISGYGK